MIAYCRHAPPLQPPHITTHAQLRHIWRYDQQAFGYLSFADQYNLHDYYQPSRALTEAQLRTHRKEITSEHPTSPVKPAVPSNASTGHSPSNRADQDHFRREAKQPAGAPVPTRQVRHKLTVRSAVRPELDIDKLAIAVAMFVEDQLRKSREQAEGDDVDDMDAA